MESIVKSTNTLDQAGQSLHEAINRTADATRPAVDRLAGGAHSAVDKVASVAGHAAEIYGAKSEQLKYATDQAVGTARSYVRDHPLATVGIAVAAGYLVSRLLRGR